MTFISSKPSPIKRALLTVAAIVGFFALSLYLRWFLTLDPFARFRPQTSGLGGEIGIRMEDVQVKGYEMGKLVASFHVGRIDIRKDRNNFRLANVRDGVYYGKDANLHFASEGGEYDSGARKFQGNDGARVWNADLDLKVDAFDFEQTPGRLFVPGFVEGKFYGGVLKAEKLEYFPSSDTFSTGPGVWTGKATLAEGEKPQGKTSTWTIRQSGSSKSTKDFIDYTDIDATDGEVVIKAPTARQNRKTDVIEATGRVRYFGVDANVIADKVTIYRKEKRAVLEGNVTMLIKAEENQKLEEVEIPPYTPTVPEEIAKNRPKATDSADEKKRKQDDEIRSTKNFRQYPVVISAQRIEYWYAKGSRRAEVTGSPEAFQSIGEIGSRHAWGPKAFYDAEKETLRLVGAEGKQEVRFQTSVGDDMQCEWFQVSTKKGDEDNWEGFKAKGTVVVHEDEERPTKSGGSNPPPDKNIPPLKGPIGGGKKK